MKTPKEEAIDLVNSMGFSTHVETNPMTGETIPIHRNAFAKACALIAAHKIKEELTRNLSNDDSAIHAIYWLKVIGEIKSM